MNPNFVYIIQRMEVRLTSHDVTLAIRNNSNGPCNNQAAWVGIGLCIIVFNDDTPESRGYGVRLIIYIYINIIVNELRC